MDPNATVARMLTLAARLLESDELPEPSDALELAELTDDLAAWLERGGFIPAAWMPAARSSVNTEKLAHTYGPPMTDAEVEADEAARERDAYRAELEAHRAALAEHPYADGTEGEADQVADELERLERDADAARAAALDDAADSAHTGPGRDLFADLEAYSPDALARILSGASTMADENAAELEADELEHIQPFDADAWHAETEADALQYAHYDIPADGYDDDDDPTGPPMFEVVAELTYDAATDALELEHITDTGEAAPLAFTHLGTPELELNRTTPPAPDGPRTTINRLTSFQVTAAHAAGATVTKTTATWPATTAHALEAVRLAKLAEQHYLRCHNRRAIVPHYDALARKLARLLELEADQ